MTRSELKMSGPRHKFDFPQHELRLLTAEEKGNLPVKGPRASTCSISASAKLKRFVQQHCPSYFVWIYRETVFATNLTLKAALEKAALFPASVGRRQTLSSVKSLSGSRWVGSRTCGGR